MHFVSGLIGGLVVAVAVLILWATGALDSERVVETSSGPGIVSVSPARGTTDVSTLYERVSPGVVLVQAGNGTGSGFVLDRDGYVLTNEHVVDGATNVRVRFQEGAPVPARVVGSDASTDLALLKLNPTGRALRVLALGSSKRLKVGQPAIAIGSPYRLEGTLTTGVISAIGRSITAPNNFPIDDVIQTDAAINPGNSGGPLLDARGRVIGINAQIASNTGANDGVGFAIPIDTAKQILPALRAGREIRRPLLGVSTRDAETGTGAVVEEVVPGGPASDAGLRAGDRIVAIGARRVARSTDVSSAIIAREPGDEVTVRVRRDGAVRTLTVTLGTRPRFPG